MTTQIRRQNGITILEPSGKDSRIRSIRITENNFTTNRGFRLNHVSSSISSTSIGLIAQG